MADPEKAPPRDLDERFVAHLRQKARRKPSQEAKDRSKFNSKSQEEIQSSKTFIGSPKRPSPEPDGDEHGPEAEASPAKRRKSPPPSPSNQASAKNRRGGGRAAEPKDFDAAPRGHGALWQDGGPALARPTAARGGGQQGNSNNSPRGGNGPAHRRGQGQTRGGAGGGGGGSLSSAEMPSSINELTKQPETRPISQEQLIAEVKGIYAGLVMVESRCIEVDGAQTSLNDNPDSPQLTNDQWQALISLHRALLHEHHDFFLASQHPSAGLALRRLASKYAMPARMWRHGIHSFLELLRNRLPGSSEYMLSFIYLAYSMMALLYETVPAFEDTWIECLGDLSRYRMAIEDDDIHDRNVWTAVSRSWYSKASDKAPTTGRLHHHLAILARPDVTAQLFYYLKSLTVAIPFRSARDSILTLFEPIMSGAHTKILPVNKAFIQVHGVFFTNKYEHLLEGARHEFLSNLDLTIARSTRKWLEPGHQIAISNIAAVLGHGALSNALMKAIRPEDAAADTSMEAEADDELQWGLRVRQALQFSDDTDRIVFARLGDLNTLSYLHVRLMWIFVMSSLDPAMARLENTLHWHLLTLALNACIPESEHPETYESGDFPTIPSAKPLPEDWALRGLVWTERVFPANHFDQVKTEDDERMFETPSLGEYRRQRILYFACRIAEKARWITYDKEAHRFSVLPKYESADIDARPAPAKAAPVDDEEILPDADAASTVGGGPSERLMDDEPAVDSPQPQPEAAPVTIIQPDRESQA